MSYQMKYHRGGVVKVQRGGGRVVGDLPIMGR